MPKLSLLEFEPAHAAAFRDINIAWIEEMFAVESKDREILDNPQTHIIDKGGAILMVHAEDIGIVGTCALMPVSDGVLELTKMGVLSQHRGLKAGAFLLAGAIDRARGMCAERLYLLTNKKCEAAIHLYLKAGFKHDADIMRLYGGAYARADVAMDFSFQESV